MERFDRITAQAMLARETYLLSSDSELRISLMLLDNLAEMLMHSAVRRQEQIRSLWGAPILRRGKLSIEVDLKNFAQRDQFEDKTVHWTLSKSTARALEREFATKLRYLAWWGSLPVSYVPVVSRLHDYRNEAYHRDQLRKETLQTSVEIYLHIVAELLRTLKPNSYTSYGGSKAPDRLAERLGIEMAELHNWSFDLQALIAERMTADIDLEGAAIAGKLAENIESRLMDLEGAFELIADVAGAAWGQEMTRMDAMRLAQTEGHVWGKEDLQNASVAVTKRKYDDFKRQARVIAEQTDPLQAFTQFAEFELGFEDFESKVVREAIAADTEVQRQIDMARGK